jgi:hypothetical protein
MPLIGRSAEAMAGAAVRNEVRVHRFAAQLEAGLVQWPRDGGCLAWRLRMPRTPSVDEAFAAARTAAESELGAMLIALALDTGNKGHEVARARHIVWYAVRDMLGAQYELAAVASVGGARGTAVDRSSVDYGVRECASLIETDAKHARQLGAILSRTRLLIEGTVGAWCSEPAAGAGPEAIRKAMGGRHE